MAKWEIGEPTNADALALARTLRENDRREIEVAGLRSARAVWRSYRLSLYRRVIKVDGEVAGIWGIGTQALSDVGEVWLLTAPAIEKIPFTFVRQGMKEVEKMLELYPVLTGVVHCDYSAAKKFLSVLGFSLHPGDPFFTFSMRR